MDEDRIGLVLAKTSELRSKIVSSVRKKDNVKDDKESESNKESEAENEDGEVDEEEEESLLNIKDALESLEGQLSSLQALQNQQWYERETALAEIEYSQKKLLKELKEYKGKDLEVIREAIAFASETEENNSDLLLPPYPSRVSGNGFPSTFSSSSTRKIIRNGTLTRGGVRNIDSPLTTNLHERDISHEGHLESKGPFKNARFLIGAVAKAALSIIGVISILSLAGFEPKLKKRNQQFKVSDLFKLLENRNEMRTGVDGECPPGKVAVIENGEMRCVVKERVEVPFESVVANPDVCYGCG